MSGHPTAKRPESRMTIPVRDQKMLWGAASSRCSFPKCEKRLVAEMTADDPAVILGEMAHIVAESLLGPRGESPLPIEERNKYENLILLCEEHHKVIDGQPLTYSIEAVHRFKREHETRCQRPFEEDAGDVEVLQEQNVRQDRLHATALPVVKLPRFVYSAECLVDDEKALKDQSLEITGNRPPPFIIRGKRLLAFDDVRRPDGPFARWVRPKTRKRLHAEKMWNDPDQVNYYIALLNRILRKLAGMRGLDLDFEHHRWFFSGSKDGTDIEKEYTPLNLARSSRKVAWRPTIRATGEKRSFWEHLAVALRFHRVTPNLWVLAIRPERHYTRDGRTPLSAKTKGRRATKRAAHLYNHDLLEDLNFWRSYLGRDEPRIIWKAGAQTLIIEAKLVEVTVSWPGVPEDFKPFANTQSEEDLFTHAALRAALDLDSDEDFEDDEEPLTVEDADAD